MIYNIFNITCYKYYNLYIFFPYIPAFAKTVSTHVNAKKILNTLADYSRPSPAPHTLTCWPSSMVWSDGYACVL